MATDRQIARQEMEQARRTVQRLRRERELLDQRIRAAQRELADAAQRYYEAAEEGKPHA